MKSGSLLSLYLNTEEIRRINTIKRNNVVASDLLRVATPVQVILFLRKSLSVQVQLGKYGPSIRRGITVVNMTILEKVRGIDKIVTLI